MNRITRNLLAMLMAVVCCALTAGAFLFAELRFGQPLFFFTAWTYVPLGAIGAGLVAAMGYYVSSLVLRARPLKVMLVGIVVLAAASVFVVDSAEYGLMTVNPTSIRGAGAWGEFLAKSMTTSPLIQAFSGGSGSDASSGGGGGSQQMASLAGDNNQSVQGIGGGVQGMLTSADAVSTDNPNGALAGISRRAEGVQAFGSGVLSHSRALGIAGAQTAAFALAALLAYFGLRRFAYCDDCSVLLSRKGQQTRYFSSAGGARDTVDEFLSLAKGRRFRQSIQVHAEDGAKAETKLSAFASTIAISRCKGCHRHQLSFSARHKEGESWKEIPVLSYSTFCLEPIDVVRG